MGSFYAVMLAVRGGSDRQVGRRVNRKAAQKIADGMNERAVAAFGKALAPLYYIERRAGKAKANGKHKANGKALKVAKQKCRVCGCTDDDCRQCVEKTGEPCHWVEPDLCSACHNESLEITVALQLGVFP